MADFAQISITNEEVRLNSEFPLYDQDKRKYETNLYKINKFL